MEVIVELHVPAALWSGKERLMQITKEAGWAVWIAAPHGTRILDHPARTQALYHSGIPVPYLIKYRQNIPTVSY